jgi:NAD(P)H-nitrite reductase large subunit
MSDSGLPELKVVEDKLVCDCYGMTESEMFDALRKGGYTSFEEVNKALMDSGGCAACKDDVERILAKIAEDSGA